MTARKPSPRTIVSRYNGADTFDRTTHPEQYPRPAIHRGEVLSFADREWAIWFAERRGWFVFGNSLFPEIATDDFTNVDTRCSIDTLASVFALVLEEERCQRLAAECVKNKLSPKDYEAKIPSLF